jgi:hypothetical protein
MFVVVVVVVVFFNRKPAHKIKNNRVESSSVLKKNIKK